MSDRIAVMSAGVVQQVGTPAQIYETPANQFIANFIGETNLLVGSVVEVNSSQARVRLPTGDLITADIAQPVSVGDSGVVSLRPERLQLEVHRQSEEQHEWLVGVLCEEVYLGTDHQYRVKLADGSLLTVRAQNSRNVADHPACGDKVCLNLSSGAARFLVD
jgi:spermidine/putrescine transport system ATP-binding protein